MAEFVRVRAVNGDESIVSKNWVERWPEDFTVIEEAPDGGPQISVPESTEQTATAETETPGGEQEKEAE